MKCVEALSEALEHHKAGRWERAGRLYGQVLEADPGNVDALHLAGVLAWQRGDCEAACLRIREAVRRAPRVAMFRNSLGNVLRSLGRLSEAAECFRAALELDPQHGEAAFNLGLTCFQLGRIEQAAAHFARAVELNPRLAEGWRNLAAVRLRQGDAAEAAAHLERALRLRPDFPEAYNDLGCALDALGRPEEALAAFGEALGRKPDFAEARLNLGNVLSELGRLEEAAAAYREALRRRPGWAEAHVRLASALAALRRSREAAEHCRRALEIRADLAEAHNVLGITLEAQGQAEAALQCYARALELRPEFPEALNNQGNALARLGRPAEAEISHRAALALRPGYATAWNNLGHVLEVQGAAAEAVACYRRALEWAPEFALAHSNLLLALHYLPGADPESIFAEHRRWAERQATARPGRRPAHDNEPEPERRLRLGYLSADLRTHSVAFFLEAVLEEHDREGFQLIGYSNSPLEDATTARLRALLAEWRCVHELSDEEAAERIRRDRVDILVDLGGHTAGGRPRLLALKPAPVQVSWLGYPDTTGLEEVDYRLSDELADPPGLTEGFYTERLLRLPAPFLCYRPPAEAPPPGPLPARRQGRITFGAFHNLAKIHREAAQAWTQILRAVPGSRLLMKAAALGEARVRERISELFASCGLETSRLELRGRVPDLRGHLSVYQEADIALDAFPYAGTTTTCEALWMGVPVVTLVGRTHASRTGLSLLSAVGLRELAAASLPDYIATAARLAAAPDRLAELRAGLRARMAASPLADGRRFARCLEKAYREMWRRWCEGRER